MRMGQAEPWSDVDVRLMRRAIRLSQRGWPAPNPHVGCVIARDGEIVGEGFHGFAGGNHAEVEALLAAGHRAEGATAYVTLEPCNHHGRTPPCTRALIQAGIARVVGACTDPNPPAHGGFEILREAGIQVEQGLLEGEAASKNEQFLTAMALKRPRVLVKAAISLDGRVALPTGESKWITGPDARRRAHRLRAECGAVLVGRKTVEADDPMLTARLPGVVNQPVRVVLDPGSKLDTHWKVFDSSAPTLHVVDGALGLRAGAGGFDLAALCAALFERGLTGLMIEGGPRTVSSFLRAGLVDAIELFVAPKLLGSGTVWAEDLGIKTVDQALQYEVRSLKKLKADVQISLRTKRGTF